MLFIAPTNTRAQVVNDSIQNRILLKLNEIHPSKTNNCTVEWDCVDESLTGKCIEYHNDQWFYFNSGKYQKLYINIMNQQCRDLRGVQIVVIDGKPCDVNTYDVLRCVSLANQDDIYVRLDSLINNHDYLINIDGYLHDFCAFEIEVSPEAKGFSLEETIDLPVTTSRKDSVIQINWKISDSLIYAISGFEVYRRKAQDFRHTFQSHIDLSANAYGDIKKMYSYSDTIAPNTKYIYRLMAINNEDRLIHIDDYQFYFQFKPQKPQLVRYVQIPLEDVKNKQSVSVIIYDYDTNKKLESAVFTYRKNDPRHINFSTSRVFSLGTNTLLVKVINNTTKNTKEYIFELWE
jgi:hypothetical protein